RGGGSRNSCSPGRAFALGIAYVVNPPEGVILTTSPGPPPAQHDRAAITQRFPSEPVVMSIGSHFKSEDRLSGGRANSVMAPKGVILATLPAFVCRVAVATAALDMPWASANQMLPSGPSVIALTPSEAPGMAYSTNVPEVVTLTMKLAPFPSLPIDHKLVSG